MIGKPCGGGKGKGKKARWHELDSKSPGAKYWEGRREPVDDVVDPRFADGLPVWTGIGQQPI